MYHRTARLSRIAIQDGTTRHDVKQANDDHAVHPMLPTTVSVHHQLVGALCVRAVMHAVDKHTREIFFAQEYMLVAQWPQESHCFPPRVTGELGVMYAPINPVFLLRTRYCHTLNQAAYSTPRAQDGH
jgi:hypothetical protein